MHVVLHVDEWKPIGRRGGLGGLADRLRRRLARAIAPGLAGERRAVLEGIVLGDDEALSDDLRQDFRASGLYHLLAVSGQNVILVAGGVLVLAWLAGVSRWIGELGALAGIAAYVLAVGAQPSVVRAGIAGALASLAWMAGRLRDAWYALLLGAVALLAWNPYLVFDAGFQLSFAAVAAIFTLVPRLTTLARGLPDAARSSARPSPSRPPAALATAPILWLQFGALPLLTVPANALAEPAIPLLLALAFVTAGLGVVSPSGGRARRLAERLGRGLRRALRARDRLASVRPDHDVPRPRGAPRAPFSPPPMLGADGRGAEARVPARRERPPEGRPRAPAAAGPVRAGRGRAAHRRRGDPARTWSRRRTRSASSPATAG